jgi:hypothetical protein
MDLITLGIGPQGSVKFIMTGGLEIGEAAAVWTPIAPATTVWTPVSAGDD